MKKARVTLPEATSEPVQEPLKVVANSELKENKKLKSLGEILRSVRESKNIEIPIIADALRISRNYLIAIEGMDKEELPEQVYALGFVRSYAHYLGIDPQKSVDQFKREIYEQDEVKQLVLPEPIQSASLPSRRLLIMCAIALVIAIVGGRFFMSSPQKTSVLNDVEHLLEPLDTATDEGTPAAAESEAPSQETSQAPAPAPAPIAQDTETVSLVFHDKTWLELKDSKGTPLISKNFQTGDTYTFKLSPGMTFSTGNAGGFDVRQAGKTYKAGTKGQILKVQAMRPDTFQKIGQ